MNPWKLKRGVEDAFLVEPGVKWTSPNGRSSVLLPSVFIATYGKDQVNYHGNAKPTSVFIGQDYSPAEVDEILLALVEWRLSLRNDLNESAAKDLAKVVVLDMMRK